MIESIIALFSNKITWATLAIFAERAYAFYRKCKAKYGGLIQELVEVIEQAAKDGIITKDERKEIALKAVKWLENYGQLKINFIERFILNILIDKFASKLPDFKISTSPKLILNEVLKNK